MSTGSVFENNRTQAVRLPVEARFPEGVKRVAVRVLGRERIMAPEEHAWDSFFHVAEGVTDDFMVDRACQDQGERELL